MIKSSDAINYGTRYYCKPPKLNEASTSVEVKVYDYYSRAQLNQDDHVIPILLGFEITILDVNC